jgi:DNA-binding NtrC family response regulator
VIKILVVERSLLQARTIAAMYETFDCELALASDVNAAADVLVRSRIDVVIMSLRFCRESGVAVRDAVRALQPGLRIAVLGEPGDLRSGACPPADFHVRPTHFYTDLRRHLAPAQESPEHPAQDMPADAA